MRERAVPVATTTLERSSERVGAIVASASGALVAGSVTLDLEELPAVHDMLAARTPESALVHDHWADNVFLETFVDVDIGKALDAPIKVTR